MLSKMLPRKIRSKEDATKEDSMRRISGANHNCTIVNVLYHYKELAASVAVETASAAAVETDSAALSAALFKEGLADGKRNST